MCIQYVSLNTVPGTGTRILIHCIFDRAHIMKQVYTSCFGLNKSVCSTGYSTGYCTRVLYSMMTRKDGGRY